MSITPIPVEMKMAVLELHGWNCLCCGRPMHRYPDSRVRPDTLSFDHVLPEKYGGLTVVENLQPLCVACNLHKGVDTIDLRTEAKLWRHRLDMCSVEMRSSPRFLRTLLDWKPVWSMSLFQDVDPASDRVEREFIQRAMNDRRKVDGVPSIEITDQRWKEAAENRDVHKLNWYGLKTDYHKVSRAVPPCPVRDRMRIAA